MSAALTHLHTGNPWAATVPITSVPNGLTRKQPLFMRSGPLPNIPYKALEIDPEDQPKPDLSCPTPHRDAIAYLTYPHLEQMSSPNVKGPTLTVGNWLWRAVSAPTPRPIAADRRPIGVPFRPHRRNRKWCLRSATSTESSSGCTETSETTPYPTSTPSTPADTHQLPSTAPSWQVRCPHGLYD